MSSFTNVLLAFASAAIPALAADLTIPLPGNADMKKKTVKYRCDPSGTKLGLPADVFPVEYINGGGNSLVVVPISGRRRCTSCCLRTPYLSSAMTARLLQTAKIVKPSEEWSPADALQEYRR